MIQTKLDDVRHNLNEFRRQYDFLRPQDCAVTLSRDALLDVLAEYNPSLNRFELAAYADTVTTLYGAKIIIDPTAKEPVVSMHVRFTKEVQP